jgi:hypothetical protein
MLVIFDLLAVEGRDVTRRPYWERRQLLEDLRLEGDAWSTTPSHTDGEAVMGQGLPTWPRRRRGEETLGPLPARPSRLDQDDEPRLLAIPAGARRRAGAALGFPAVAFRAIPTPPYTARYLEVDGGV